MIDLEYLEEARILLVFLEILHDLATIDPNSCSNFDQFQKVMENTC